MLIRVQKVKSKRNFGGLSVMVKKSISAGIIQMPVNHTNFMWFKLSHTYFNLCKDLRRILVTP